MSVFLYNFLIRAYHLGIRISALFNTKAKLWIKGRKGLFIRLKDNINSDAQWIWVHAASLGEFEQGRPLIELLKVRHPDHKILLTFFSPSGYTVRKDYEHADHVSYMPLDTPANARRFVAVVKPRLAIFIKYEIWHNHLMTLIQASIPVILISAQFRRRQIYFLPWGAFLRRRLQDLTQIFVTTVTSAELLSDAGLTNVTVAGDTRIDRVIQGARSHKDFAWLRACLGKPRVLVAGSTWPRDEQLLLASLKDSDVALVIAPHEVHPERIKELVDRLPGTVCTLRELVADRVQCDGIVVDTIGDLSSLYHIADIAYVGGGFDRGIHNILEPAAYQIPVLIGPNFQRFEEAVTLRDGGCVTAVRSPAEAAEAIARYWQPGERKAVKTRIKGYLEQHRGATEQIYAYIRAHNLLEHAGNPRIPG